jgi:glycosyltransferase involved in cell wall biosynthesis
MGQVAKPGCSVVIRCFNEERHIGRLLDGLLQQTVREHEIVVVDSGSTDGTLDVASRYPAKIIGVTPEEFSFGRSLNRGCAAASSELIVVASAHVYPVYSDWLERLVQPFADREVGLVYGKQRGDERTKYSERQVFAAWFGEQPNPAQDHPFCNNANAAIRRSLWERLPYDESLTGLEDIAWARAAMGLGYRIVYEPAAEVVHVHEETAARLYNRYRREAIALKGIFPEERFGLWDLLRLFVGNVASDLYHATGDGVLVRSVGSVLMFRLMQFWGTYRGFARRRPVTSGLRQTFYYPRLRARTIPDSEQSRAQHRIEYLDSRRAKGRDGGG